jgi:hypothetical protein
LPGRMREQARSLLRQAPGSCLLANFVRRKAIAGQPLLRLATEDTSAGDQFLMEKVDHLICNRPAGCHRSGVETGPLWVGEKRSGSYLKRRAEREMA